MTGEAMWNDYRDAAFTHGIVLPYWYQLNPIQRMIWNTMALEYEGGPTDL